MGGGGCSVALSFCGNHVFQEPIVYSVWLVTAIYSLPSTSAYAGSFFLKCLYNTKVNNSPSYRKKNLRFVTADSASGSVMNVSLTIAGLSPDIAPHNTQER